MVSSAVCRSLMKVLLFCEVNVDTRFTVPAYSSVSMHVAVLSVCLVCPGFYFCVFTVCVLTVRAGVCV